MLHTETNHIKCLQSVFDRMLTEKDHEMGLSFTVVNDQVVELQLCGQAVDKFSTKERATSIRTKMDNFLYETFGKQGIEFGENVIEGIEFGEAVR